MQKEIGEMLAAKVIQLSTSPWASPIVLEKEKDGGVKFYVDFCRGSQV